MLVHLFYHINNISVRRRIRCNSVNLAELPHAFPVLVDSGNLCAHKENLSHIGQHQAILGNPEMKAVVLYSFHAFEYHQPHTPKTGKGKKQPVQTWPSDVQSGKHIPSISICPMFNSPPYANLRTVNQVTRERKPYVRECDCCVSNIQQATILSVSICLAFVAI